MPKHYVNTNIGKQKLASTTEEATASGYEPGA